MNDQPREFIICKELLAAGLKPFQLFEYFKQKLLHRIHSLNGRKIVDRDAPLKWEPEKRFEEILKVECLVGGDWQTGKIFTKRADNSSYGSKPKETTDAEIRQAAQDKYDQQPKEY